MSLIELQRRALLSHLNAVQTDNGLKYLVLDETTNFLVRSLLDQNTLLQNVTAVERIDEPRKPKPSIDAVYILDPTKFSLACLKTDFKVQPPRYRLMFVYLLPSPSNEAIIRSFSANTNPAYRLLRFIKVFNFNLYPIEDRVFLSLYDTSQDPSVPIQKSFDAGDPKLREKERSDYEKFLDRYNLNTYSMQIFYNPVFLKLASFVMDSVVNSLLNLCIVTNEYPIIRYYNPSVAHTKCTAVSRIIATKLEAKIEEYLRENPKFSPNSGNGGVERSVLLVTDRTMDLIEVFIHEFNYEAILYDFFQRKEFNSKNRVVFYEANNAQGAKLRKVAKLGVEDKYYEKYRFLHISEAYEQINKDIQKFFDDNPLLVDTDRAQTTTDLLVMMAHQQEFGEEQRLLTLHKQLIERFLLLIINTKFPAISEVEQTLAAGGYDINKQHVRYQTLTNDMIERLDSMGAAKLDTGHKVRMILVYALTKKDGILELDLVKLLKFIGLTSTREVEGYVQLFRNLRMLNRDVLRPPIPAHSHQPAIKELPNSATYHEIDDTELNTSRYKPGLQKVITGLVRGSNQGMQEFPYANEANNHMLQEMENMLLSSSTSLRKKTNQANWQLESTWASRLKGKVNRQKVFVYMVGGITPAEIKTVYELGDKLNKDIFLGSEHILVPGETLFNIQNLNNSNTKELNPFLPPKLAKESSDEVPSFLKEAPEPMINAGRPMGGRAQGPPSSGGHHITGQYPSGATKQPQSLPGAGNGAQGQTPAPEKKHRFGFKKRK